ncbi:hypothetical protein E2562_029394 [Oryza meyeriana var. granulata]|uniref:Uncharacterized protein n=1 Tax=Oryza meyeriana var. granulata TaxID=110450 RepID=A0A6G1BZY1_9ORYZ|nr:hypothetical protein E2562_029394 [Oryza meyeriana var. granulata]
MRHPTGAASDNDTALFVPPMPSSWCKRELRRQSLWWRTEATNADTTTRPMRDDGPLGSHTLGQTSAMECLLAACW